MQAPRLKPSAPSLNEVLHTGPSLTPKILEILLRFSWHRIAIVADIMKAFHMINVDEMDRNVLRFLWLSDITSDNPELLFLRFCYVVFGLNCSPFLLGGTLHHHISNYEFENMEFVRKLLESFYVDDFLSGSSTLKEAIELFLNTKKCVADGGFTLRKWKTSDPQLREFIRENDQDIAQSTHEEVKPVSEDETSYAKLNLGDTVKTTEEYNKVLGLQWNYDSDEFLLTFRRLLEFSEKLTPTERKLLKLTSMIFDPLGLISPVIVQMKMVLQEICQIKLDWDSPLPDELVIIWRKWLSDLEKVGHLRIERCYFAGINEHVVSYNLHGFCDASKRAYSAIIYLVASTESDFTFGKLITSKSRVAPLKKLTIPRLELMAAVILARLITNVQAALSNYIDFDLVNCWGDSNIVLAWLKNDQIYKQFVSNRTDEILRLTRPEDWRYCPTNDNPADIGSRGQTISELQINSLLFKGPDWLRKPQEFWPKQSDFNDELKKLEENEEYVKEIRGSVFTLFATANAGLECIRM